MHKRLAQDRPTIPLVELGAGGPLRLLERELPRAHALLALARRRHGRPLLRLGDKVSRAWLARTDNPYRHEILAVSEILGAPGAIMLNLSFEWGCTSGAAPDPSGAGNRLLRVLDWPVDGLGRHVVVARNDAPAGVYFDVTWPGAVGVLTAMAPGRFAAAINQAPMIRHGLTFAGDWAKNRIAVWHSRALPPAHLLRQVFCNAADYSAAREMLADTPIALPALFVLSGCTTFARLESDATGGAGAGGAGPNGEDASVSAGMDAAASFGGGPTGPPGPWQLTLSEDCDGSVLDAALWSTIMRVGDTTFRSWGERADWMADEQVSVLDGDCVILAEDRPSGDRPYTSGVINSAQKFEQQHGYFEARIKAPAGAGFWSVFWLRDIDGWPPAIDVMALRGDQPNQVRSQYWWVDAASRMYGRTILDDMDFTLDYHVYGVEWSEDELVYYLDGVESGRFSEGVSTIDRPLYLTFNLSIGDGETVPPPDETTPWPGELRIDWVRVYRR